MLLLFQHRITAIREVSRNLAREVTGSVIYYSPDDRPVLFSLAFRRSVPIGGCCLSLVEGGGRGKWWGIGGGGGVREGAVGGDGVEVVFPALELTVPSCFPSVCLSVCLSRSLCLCLSVGVLPCCVCHQGQVKK